MTLLALGSTDERQGGAFLILSMAPDSDDQGAAQSKPWGHACDTDQELPHQNGQWET